MWKSRYEEAEREKTSLNERLDEVNMESRLNEHKLGLALRQLSKYRISDTEDSTNLNYQSTTFSSTSGAADEFQITKMYTTPNKHYQCTLVSTTSNGDGSDSTGG